MTHEIVSVLCGGPGPSFTGNCGEGLTIIDNRDNRRSPCECYQEALEQASADVIVYVHDDLTIHDPDWIARVTEGFEHSSDNVAVGLGGATSLGHPDLYKRPYKLQDMARGGYRSNQTDWQVHGIQERGVCHVAVLDAFFMAVRRDFVLRVGGWPVAHLGHHGLDLWLACQASRHRKETWMVGCSCTHHGGGTSTKSVYARASWLQGGSLEEDHRRPHLYLYDEFRDVLPIVVKP